ncbi:uncharacterized protein H6S33_011623 [Morchella sextelata]|uniref:uncharacterized protein n=1 Tax=Morchella sextelata TaxID=1174677 RepID=UPI001D040BF9|nr:uncharacterized protein H6S33_011623 [Morchella sextelata]KAH0611196.1 hypothetical protein H6S33_011623 [Morchella sextelata]
MATTAQPSHTRDLSITRLECDINPNFSFPVPHTRSQSLLPTLTFPQMASNNSLYPPRRGSVPPSSTGPLVSLNNNRPKSSSSGYTLSSVSSKQSNERPTLTGGLRPGHRTIASGTVPTIVNASISPAGGSREGGHQRAGSEMIGGPPLMATRKEDLIQVPGTLTERARPFVPLPPSGVRRGHAHRRSGAISSGDVWSLLSQSAPSLPLACTGGAGNQGGAVDASAQPKGNAGSSPLLSKSAPVSPGFTVPSPLPSPAVPVVESMGSESGIPSAPVAAGHSAKDSISSIATVIKAPVVALPPINTTMDAPAAGRRPHGRTRSNSQTLNLPTAALRATSDRPSTAGAILSSPVLKTAPENFPETAPSLKRPAAASPSIDSAESSPTKPAQKKTHKKALSDYSPLVGKAPFSKHESMSADEQTTDKKKKKKKGKKQIKNWAGTILGKGKGLRHTTKRQSLRAPTPPVPGSENQVPGENEWITAAWNENYVLMAVDDSVHPASSTESIVIAETTEGPVIDLDAALKPFKTPVGPAAGFAAARTRRMHSAVGLKTNGYFHRRSESMPEMTLFSLEEGDDDGHMDDVSEEDESEESESEDEEGKGEGLGIGIKVVDEADGANWQEGIEMEWGSEDAGDERSMRRNSEPESEDSWHAHRASLSVSVATVKAVRSISSMNSSTTDSNVESVSISPRKGAPADIITSSSVSTITGSSPFLCPHPSTNPPDSPLTFVTATSNPNTPVLSDFATDYADSATSFDTYSDFLGEPGPEMRMSVDDVPSLTSSSSTMTMSGIYHNMPATPVLGSVGSLPIPPVKEGKEKKEGKSKRWSKVFTFWKK